MVIWGTWLTLKQLRKRPAQVKPQAISILKPLKGLDFQLEENLESFFRLEYPKFELLFSVASNEDPACEIIRRVSSKFPRVRARIFIGEVKIGGNPKVNNLIKSYQAASHDWILISDSNVRVPRDYLHAVSQEFDDETGVVTAVVSGQYLGRGFGAPLEATYLNTFYARWMLIAIAFGNPVVIGKSMLFRKSEANRFGGVELLSRYLAEDYMAGQAMKHLGKSVKVMHEPIVQMIGNYTFEEFWSRHVRWGRIRRSQSPLTFPLEPLLTFWVSGVLGSFGLSHFHLLPFANAFAVHALIWFLCDITLMLRMKQTLRPQNLLAWIVRETLHLPLWAHVAMGNTVNWRGNKLKLNQGGLLET
jgi:ceramide glucosyltransferase